MPPSWSRAGGLRGFCFLGTPRQKLLRTFLRFPQECSPLPCEFPAGMFGCPIPDALNGTSTCTTTPSLTPAAKSF